VKPPPVPRVVVAPRRRAVPMTAKPAAIVRLGPNRAVTRSDGRAPRIRPPIIGRRRMPLPIGSVPTIPWKYWGRVKRAPTIVTVATARMRMPPVKLRARNSSRSTRVLPPRRWRALSQGKKAARRAMPTTMGTMAFTVPHPYSPASISP
jgi:hypothetical protein